MPGCPKGQAVLASQPGPQAVSNQLPLCCNQEYVRPHRRQPTRLPRPWDSPGKNNGVGCHFLLQCMKVKSESEVAQLCLIFATPWTAAYQAPPSMGVSRQEYWSRLPLPSLSGRRRRGRQRMRWLDGITDSVDGPVLLPGNSHGRRSLVGCSPWGR